MADTLEQALERTRATYAAERTWHRFLLDSYTGGGGYRGRFGSPDSEMGSAARAYPSCADSYLDKYPREDDAKFKRRQAVAHYVNYVEPLTDLKVGLALGKPFMVENLPKEIEDWKSNVDGKGTKFEAMRERLAHRAALVGWAPVIVDTPPRQEGVTTLAQARELGIAPRLIPLYPANLTEWKHTDGELDWLKVRADFCERATFRDDETKYSLIDYWEPGTVTRFKVIEGKVASEELHAIGGRIPLTVLRHKPAEEDSMIGLPMNGQVAVEGRRLFNIISALDESLDASAFPLLVKVDDLGDDTDAPEGGSEVVVGAGNALLLQPDSSQKHYYLAVPADVYAAYERRAMETVREMFRMARVEFVRPAGSQNESGIARKHAFQQTNSAVHAFAKQIAGWEQDTYIAVGRLIGKSEDELSKIRVIAPDDFDVEDIEGLLARLEKALTLKLGSIFEAILKKRAVQEMAPNLDPKDLAAVNQEIDDMAVESASTDAFVSGGASDAFGALDENGNPIDPLADPNGVKRGAFGGGNRPAGPAAGAG